MVEGCKVWVSGFLANLPFRIGLQGGFELMCGSVSTEVHDSPGECWRSSARGLNPKPGRTLSPKCLKTMM